MKKLQEKTGKIVHLFQEIHKKPWTPEVIMTDLMEEVGELANAVLVKEGFKNLKRKKSCLEDSISDVLYDILWLANYYKINVEKTYEKTLKELENRVRRKEFEDD